MSFYQKVGCLQKRRTKNGRSAELAQWQSKTSMLEALGSTANMGVGDKEKKEEDEREGRERGGRGAA